MFGQAAMKLVTWCAVVWCCVGAEQPREASLLAVGDINLGRSIGQMLLKDSLELPFREAGALLQSADIVFGNLESQITDQGGETQHPTDPYVFCAPPQAAPALRRAGFTVLSTANNHAYDYGMSALRETILNLRNENLLWTGTSEDSVASFPHALIVRNGIRFAFLAYSEFVNGQGAWQGHVSIFDEERAGKEIAAARREADVIVVSYHGGVEYTQKPGKWTARHMRRLVELGADVVLGHHPHVPLGVEEYRGKLIFHSLGNFFFRQRQRYWSQRAYAVHLTYSVEREEVKRKAVRLYPLDVGNFPAPLRQEEEIRKVYERLRQQSNCTMTLTNGCIEITDGKKSSKN